MTLRKELICWSVLKRLIPSFLRREPAPTLAEANIRVQQALRNIPRSWYDVRYQQPRKSK